MSDNRPLLFWGFRVPDFEIAQPLEQGALRGDIFFVDITRYTNGASFEGKGYDAVGQATIIGSLEKAATVFRWTYDLVESHANVRGKVLRLQGPRSPHIDGPYVFEGSYGQDSGEQLGSFIVEPIAPSSLVPRALFQRMRRHVGRTYPPAAPASEH